MSKNKEIQAPGPYYFIGIAGSGMSAIAQYLQLSGEKVGGSDRQFSSAEKSPDQVKLEKLGIQCMVQNGTGVNLSYSTVITSTAIESDNPDLMKAKEIGLNIMHRSDALAMIARSKKSICVSGTSGKSTTTAMIYHILKKAHLKPSLLTGAGVQDLIQSGLIGNADYQEGEYVVMEADESDGSLVKYHPYIGLCLNVDRDHKEFTELEPLFKQFRAQTEGPWIVNSSHPRTRRLTYNQRFDFGRDPNCGFYMTEYQVEGFGCSFKLNGQLVKLPIPGEHNAENTAAAISAAVQAGVDFHEACQAMADYPGIHRRMQLLGTHKGIGLIDDYAHNPAKILAAIQCAQGLSQRVHAFFQPHGFAPTKFMKDELIELLGEHLREQDTMSFSQIYYAGGTAQKDISAEDIVEGLALKHPQTYYHPERSVIVKNMLKLAQPGDIILLMGARDPSLESFGQSVWSLLSGKAQVKTSSKPLTNDSIFS